MKVAIATFVRAYNYGAVLQAYALNKVLNDLGADCETIDYYPRYFKNVYDIDRFSLPPKNPRYLKGWLKKTIALIITRIRNKKFFEFIKIKIRLTKDTYSDIREVEEKLQAYDLFITGSDQVWNGGWSEYDEFFFLNFKQANQSKKASYAASFGFEEIDPRLENNYKEWLNGYSHYSLREKSGAEIIEKLIGCKAVVSCDPTLLLSAANWSELTYSNKEPEPYILAYLIYFPDNFLDTIKKISEEKKMKVICVPCSMNVEIMSGRFNAHSGLNADFRQCCGPEEFIELIKNASYVLTASFHGTIFSTIFHKQFLSLIDYEDGNRNIRTEEYLKSIGLCSQIFNGESEKIDNKIDWEIIDKNNNSLRKEAIEYLKELIK